MTRAASPLIHYAGTHTPIFADSEREYHWVARLEWLELDGSVVSGAVRDEVGNQLGIWLTFIDPAVLRVELGAGPEAVSVPSPMLVNQSWPFVEVKVEDYEGGTRFRSSALAVEIDHDPWRMRVYHEGSLLWRQEHEDFAFDVPQAFPFGYSVGADGSIATHETFALDVEEHLYGLGGQYGPFDKRGQRHVSWLKEAYGSNTAPVTYVEVPFFMSSRGYGIFINQSERITYELGYPSTVSGSFQVEAPVLDYFLIAGPDPKTILRRYTDLTGRAALPPEWSFGVWMSRCMYRNRAEVEDSVTRMQELGIPVDVYHLDPLWLINRTTRDLDACDFEWNERDWGDPESFIAWLRERGVRLSLWENPYVWRDTPMFEEGWPKGYFAKMPDGSPAAPTEGGAAAAIIDYTNPEAVAWVQAKHRHRLERGVACFKTDYGEAVPAEAVFHNGQTGRQVHNIYPLLYNRAVFEVTQSVHGEGGAVVFGRSGYAGSQRYPLNWSGDAQATWGGMAGAVRCGLSQAMSGAGFWAADIGGFHAPPGFSIPNDPVLYIRWAQWGLLVSHSRFHGIGAREPWRYGDDAVRIVRDFVLLRRRLRPYLWSLAQEAVQTGTPVLRPLVLEYPDDPVAPHVETQFLLGPDLLVCPVFSPEGRCRVYLPAGRWQDWWDGSVQEGPSHLELTVPLDRLPLFVREGSDRISR